jgi:hypothetical protein
VVGGSLSVCSASAGGATKHTAGRTGRESVRAARAILGLFGVIFVGVGLCYLGFPVEGAEIVGIRLDTPMAKADLRAVYGGLDLAIGLLLLRSARRGEVLVGLRIQVYAFGGLLLGRALGQTLDSPSNQLLVWLVAIELCGFVSAITAGRRLRSATTLTEQ